MRTDRPYRKALTHEEALAELQTNAGTQFDPKVVAALVRVIEPLAEPRPVRSAAAASRPAVEPGNVPSVANLAS
jgi:HD-GYP domain-containing protein (c-di-GMP phosphodiesterase class II)